MTSDFFLKEADEWREEAWRIIKARSDVIFILITKRAERRAGNRAAMLRVCNCVAIIKDLHNR